MAAAVAGICERPAFAEQSVREVLSFLVTNRSIATGDFVRDEQAAAATSDTIARLLSIELATLPIASSAGGFIYRFDSTLGTVVRLTDSFGPFFTERSMTTAKSLSSFSINYRTATFDSIDGRKLRDGTLRSTASILRGDAEPFDVETVSLRIRLDSMTIASSFGVTDRLEVSAALPIVRLTLQGERIDTYRGERFPQATGTASASGVGDAVLRAKVNLVQRAGSGIAVGAEARLPTGDEEQLLGAGRASVKPRLLASLEGARIALDGDVGYSFRGLARTLDYSGGLSVVATPRLTLIGEVYGRRLEGFGRLIETTEPHPRLLDVDTIRLTGVAETTNRLVAVAGFKWNVASSWLVSVNVARPLTRVGLNAHWVPAVTLDYSFGQ
ncbi:MAG TPA: transporter [Vicinamibacterales bacterium]|nr:transporter [Vicinamibacterales bacterium]